VADKERGAAAAAAAAVAAVAAAARRRHADRAATEAHEVLHLGGLGRVFGGVKPARRVPVVSPYDAVARQLRVLEGSAGLSAFGLVYRPRISTATALSLLAHLATTGRLPRLPPIIVRDALYTPDGLAVAVAAAATAARRASMADLATAIGLDTGTVVAAVPATLAASRGTLLPSRGGDVMSATAMADAVADAATAVDGAADGKATVASLAAAASVPAAALDDALTAALAAGGGRLWALGGVVPVGATCAPASPTPARPARGDFFIAQMRL